MPIDRKGERGCQLAGILAHELMVVNEMLFVQVDCDTYIPFVELKRARG
jgi:hypothetical protein